MHFDFFDFVDCLSPREPRIFVHFDFLDFVYCSTPESLELRALRHFNFVDILAPQT